MSSTTTQLIKEGLWTNNAGLVQLLGLCPLLAVSGSVVNGLGLGLATLLTLLASNTLVSAIRHWLRPEVRIPVFVIIIAASVTTIELAMNAWFHELYSVLGIFIPLIVTNCAIIGRAEAFASRNTVGLAMIDALAMGMGFTLLLVVLGSLREVIGQGTLFANAHLMLGEAGYAMTLVVVDDYRGFLLAILPPGAFFALGLLLVVKNLIDAKCTQRRLQTANTMRSPNNPLSA